MPVLVHEDPAVGARDPRLEVEQPAHRRAHLLVPVALGDAAPDESETGASIDTRWEVAVSQAGLVSR
jgi:hypothetical protein